MVKKKVNTYAVCQAFQKQPNNTYLDDGVLIFISTVILKFTVYFQPFS